MNSNQAFLDFENDLIEVFKRHYVLRAEVSISKKAFERLGEPTEVCNEPYNFEMLKKGVSLKILPRLEPRTGAAYKIRTHSGAIKEIPLADD